MSIKGAADRPPSNGEAPSFEALVSLFGLYVMKLNTRRTTVTLSDSALSMARDDLPSIEIPLSEITGMRLSHANPSLYKRIRQVLVRANIGRPYLGVKLKGKTLERRLFAGEDLPSFVDFTEHLVRQLLRDRNIPVVVGFRLVSAVALLTFSSLAATFFLLGALISFLDPHAPMPGLPFLFLAMAMAFLTYQGRRLLPKRAKTFEEFREASAAFHHGIATAQPDASEL